MKDWDKVFTTGWHTDSNGNKKLWTTEDLDKIVNSFNPTFHEPPVVIGHPSDNAPAFGWVAGIKRVGEDLYLKYKEVADEFKEWTRKGLFKKKSIAVYPDGSLRHIGYLGAMPPAIKGLPDFQFNDGDKGAAVTYEFSDWRMSTIGRVIMRLRDYLIEKEGAEKADAIIGSWDVQDLLTPPPEPETINNPCYNEPKEEHSMKPDEVKALIDDALKGQEPKFNEQLKGIADSIKGLSGQFSELQKGQATDREAGQRREFKEFLMAPEMQRRVSEGSREATINHMMTLVGADPVMFEEAGERKTISAVDDYKKHLQALPEVVAFGEHATRDKVGDVTVNGMTAEDLSQKAVEFQEAETKAGRTVSMTDAVAHVKKGGK